MEKDKDLMRTIATNKEPWVEIYFDTEEELDQYIKYHKIENYLISQSHRLLRFLRKELEKEK